MLATESVNAEIARLRQKVTDNSITREELRDAIELLRRARGQAAAAKPASRVAKSKAPVDTAAMLDDFDNFKPL